MESLLDKDGMKRIPSEELYVCYEGFRSEPRTAIIGDWHIFTYCINEVGHRMVFQDGWADPTDSFEHQKEDDILLGVEYKQALLAAQKLADQDMADQCYGAETFNSSEGVDLTFPKLHWQTTCDEIGDDKLCKDFNYPKWPISYDILKGCYCFGWQQQFREAAGFPLDSLENSWAGLWLPDKDA